MGEAAPGSREATYPSPLGLSGRLRPRGQMALDCERGLLSVLGSKGPELALVGGGCLCIRLGAFCPP